MRVQNTNDRELTTAELEVVAGGIDKKDVGSAHTSCQSCSMPGEVWDGDNLMEKRLLMAVCLVV